MPNEVRITRRIAATRDEIFDAWTDPKSVMEWMIPFAGGSTKAQLDARIGGLFHIELINQGQTYRKRRSYTALTGSEFVARIG
jgi:uncharacterized protein YndB with AHSA1/START domain